MSRRSLSRLSGTERQAITVFMRRLSERFPGQVQQVTLFGSKARGDSGPWSDIDILVIVSEESWPMRAEISTIAARVSYEYDVLIGPRVIGQERWERMKRGRFGLYENIATDGIPLATPSSAGRQLG